MLEPSRPAAYVRERIGAWRGALARPGVRKVAESAFWLFADRIVRLGLGLVVGVAVARYLGPELYGRFNYVIALVTLFGVGVAAGTDNVVVRDLAKDPLRQGAILSAAAAIRLVGVPLVLAAVAGTTLALHRDDAEMVRLVALYAATLVVRPADVVDLWFQAETNARPAVWARNLAFFASAAARVALLVQGASIVAFMAVEPLAAALGAAFLLVAFRLEVCRPALVRPVLADVLRLLRTGAPLFVSGLAIVVYMRIDQVMLEHMAGGGTAQVGLYSAALRLSEVWYFLPVTLTASVFPTLVRSRGADPSLYLVRLRRLFSLMALVALAVATVATAASAQLVRLVYGSGFDGAGPVLAVHVWTAIFVFWGVVAETWYLNEDLTHLTLYRTASAAVGNVLLNLVLIPRYGAVGAAVATLVSQAWAGWLSNALWARTRPLFFLQLQSLSPRSLLA